MNCEITTINGQEYQPVGCPMPFGYQASPVTSVIAILLVCTIIGALVGAKIQSYLSR